MKLLNERAQVREVAALWKSRYFKRGKWTDTLRGSSEETYKRLLALDPETATAADVKGVVGTSWCAPSTCNECGAESWDVVQLGQEPDHDASTAWICVACLRKAVALVESEARP
jgi:hypothetical protein